MRIDVVDVDAAVVEMRRAAKLGAKGFYIRPDMVNGRTLGHPAYDPIWTDFHGEGTRVFTQENRGVVQEFRDPYVGISPEGSQAETQEMLIRHAQSCG